MIRRKNLELYERYIQEAKELLILAGSPDAKNLANLYEAIVAITQAIRQLEDWEEK